MELAELENSKLLNSGPENFRMQKVSGNICVQASPMLITFLGLPAYEEVGIALASDILASASTLNRATGVVLAVLGTAILAVNYLG